MARKKRKTITVNSGKGIGDTLETVIKKTGVKKIADMFIKGDDCGCEERKKKLNKLFSYKLKARCFTEDEFKSWKEFKSVVNLSLSNEQTSFLCNLHSSVFNTDLYVPCRNCSPKPFIRMIDNLDVVYDSYYE